MPITDHDARPRRLGRLAITSSLIGRFFTDGGHAYFVEADGIPADGRVIGCEWDFARQAVVLFFEDMGETTPPGDVPTEISPILRDLTPEDLAAMRIEAARKANESWVARDAMARTEQAEGGDAPYGYCPVCGARGVCRERSPHGKTYCERGHGYPSTRSLDKEADAR